MEVSDIIQSRIDMLNLQQGNDTKPQNVQLYEFAIRQLEMLKESIELQAKTRR